MSTAPLVIGVDVGTQGVRALLVEASGTVVARGHRPLPVPVAGPVQEQFPADWWTALLGALADLGEHRREAISLAISCTSGSVCPIAGNGEPAGPALLYSDRRAITTADDDPSWAIAKIRWLLADQAFAEQSCARFTTPGGLLAERLIGTEAAVDETQALKFGYDPARREWTDIPVSETALPPVVPTGTPIGTLSAAAAGLTGLRTGTTVLAGATDGVAAQFACRPTPERWVVTIGTTIVWKTVTVAPIRVPEHGIYSHRGPDDSWLPGAASDAGARILTEWTTPDRIDALAREARFSPTTPAAYPSVLRGERFPFRDADFEPWVAPAAAGPDRYAAEILGIALVERWGCEQLVAHGCTPAEVVVTTGGIVGTRAVNALRADVLGIPVEIPAEPSSAFGAAVIAAGSFHGGIRPASERMVRMTERFEPSGADDWSDALSAFRAACLEHRRGAA